MIERNERPRGALLVGSVPLRGSEEVFRLAGQVLGDRLRRIPDGETGERSSWIEWQLEVFSRNAALERAPEEPVGSAPLPQFRPKPGVTVSDLHFADLGYAAAARASFRAYSKLCAEGVIPPGVRFQVSLPTPLAPVSSFVAREARAEVEPAYEEAMAGEVDRIVGALPRQDLAVQWDVAVELAILDGVWPSHLASPMDDIVERLVRIGDHVPEPAELGYHLCYGDFAHRHFVEPSDAGRLVELTNRVAAGLSRPLQWVHMPVPRAGSDEAYLAPLRRLELAPETELYLGLVHDTDGVEGAVGRIRAARRTLTRDFGLATECGLGRRPPGRVPELLQLHRRLTAPIR